MLNTKKFSKAYVEVLEILSNISKEDVNKIPRDILNVMEKNKDKNYTFEFDNDKTLEEQSLMRETKAILAYIFVNYWSSPEQKETIEKKFNNDIRKSEKSKEEKYSTDIFETIRENKENEKQRKKCENMQIKAYRKENFLSRLFRKMKKIFKDKMDI